MDKYHKTMLPDGWEIVVAKNFTEVESLRPVWEKLQREETYPVLNADIDRYLSVLQASEGEVHPLIVLLEQNGHARAMIIGREEKHTLPVRIGYKTFFKLRLRCLTVVYGGVLGKPDEQVSVLLVEAIMRLLRQEDVDIAYFSHLRVDSLFYQQIRRLPSFLCRNHFPVIEPHWRMEVPENVDTFFLNLSKKHRANLKRTIRNFEDQYKGNIELKEAGKNIDCMSQDAEKISLNTYQHALNAGFSRSPLTQSILATDAKLDRLRMSILYVDGQPCAFQWGTVIKNTYFLEKIGFDPEWAQHGIGNILFIMVLEQICSHNAITYIDYGFGDAHYKRSYCDESWSEAAATYLFVPRFYPVLINLVNSLNSGFTLGLTWFLHKTRVFIWVKRNWRKMLQTKESHSD
jgi:hypothetical protein